MSTDAWIEEHWIGGAVLLRSRRAPKLPALPVPHAPTYSCGNAALAAHAQSRDSARHPGDCLSAWQDSRNVVDQQARKLTQPAEATAKSVPEVPVVAHRQLDEIRNEFFNGGQIADHQPDRAGCLDEHLTQREHIAARAFVISNIARNLHRLVGISL